MEEKGTNANYEYSLRTYSLFIMCEKRQKRRTIGKKRSKENYS